MGEGGVYAIFICDKYQYFNLNRNLITTLISDEPVSPPLLLLYISMFIALPYSKLPTRPPAAEMS